MLRLGLLLGPENIIRIATKLKWMIWYCVPCLGLYWVLCWVPSLSALWWELYSGLCLELYLVVALQLGASPSVLC